MYQNFEKPQNLDDCYVTNSLYNVSIYIPHLYQEITRKIEPRRRKKTLSNKTNWVIKLLRYVAYTIGFLVLIMGSGVTYKYIADKYEEKDGSPEELVSTTTTSTTIGITDKMYQVSETTTVRSTLAVTRPSMVTKATATHPSFRKHSKSTSGTTPKAGKSVGTKPKTSSRYPSKTTVKTITTRKTTKSLQKNSKNIRTTRSSSAYAQSIPTARSSIPEFNDKFNVSVSTTPRSTQITGHEYTNSKITITPITTVVTHSTRRPTTRLPSPEPPLNACKRQRGEMANHIVYAEGDYFKLLNPDSPNEDVMKPIRYSIKSLENKKTIDFDIGFNNDEIFFSDDRTIFSIRISDGKQEEIFSVQEGYYITDLATSREKRVIFFYKNSLWGKNHSIQVIGKENDNKTFEEVLVELNTARDETLEFTRHSLAVQSRVFYSLKYDHSKLLSDLIANKTIADKYPVTIPWSHSEKLALDYVKNEVYSFRMNHITLDMSHRFQDKKEFVRFSLDRLDLHLNDPENFNVEGKWIYVSTSKNILRFDKQDGSNLSELISLRRTNDRIHSMRILGCDFYHSQFASNYWK